MKQKCLRVYIKELILELADNACAPSSLLILPPFSLHVLPFDLLRPDISFVTLRPTFRYVRGEYFVVKSEFIFRQPHTHGFAGYLVKQFYNILPCFGRSKHAAL